ncbi:hypothetical protein BU16DRAFT_334079 [Lophium mytilinum]|uniref:Uncharacterized protein n=1 Tax=Lophium mytilinum TaxID=390894 RepID=A0A6A6R3W3_9PEZI|nr:hypothetical protein BU16DRAFT_334079 [Lophium mytilinum]
MSLQRNTMELRRGPPFAYLAIQYYPSFAGVSLARTDKDKDILRRKATFMRSIRQ